MKIVARDNFGRDGNGGKSERLVAENIQWVEEAHIIAEALNARGGAYTESYFVVMPDDYELFVFEGY